MPPSWQQPAIGDVDTSYHHGDVELRGHPLAERETHQTNTWETDQRSFLSIPQSTLGAGTITPQTTHDDASLLITTSPGRGQRIKRFAQHRWFTGWRGGALVSLIGAICVCIFNISMTLYVWKRPDVEMTESIGTLFKGNCEKTRSLNVWIHFIVNVLSTLLLAASNYCMQVLCAPNAEELARAHAQRYWLQIGVPSTRNLRRIGADRMLLWLLLMLSSVPLHLLFNSVVFTTLQANEYAVIPTTQDWLRGSDYNSSSFIDVDDQTAQGIIENINLYRPNLTDTIKVDGSSVADRYTNVSTADCFNQYNGQYLSRVGNIYLLQNGATVWRNGTWYPEFTQYTDYPDANPRTGNFTWVNLNQAPPWNETNNSRWGSWNSTLKQWKYSSTNSRARALTQLTHDFPYVSSPNIYPSNGWRCASHLTGNCSVSNPFEVPQNRSQWAPYERPVSQCLVEQVEEVCRLRFSFTIAILVIVSNIVKASCMALVLWRYRNHAIMITTGDAVAHYLEHPDSETRGRCLQPRQLIETEWFWESAHGIKKHEIDIKPQVFKPSRIKWAKAPAPGRWFFTYTVYLIVIVVGLVCSILSLKGMPSDVKKLWEIGFGVIKGNNIFNFRTSLMVAVLIANSPQAALSYLYLSFNTLYTSMLVAKEWTEYTHKCKPLRVTLPFGQQRSTYWLNVPFRYAIPMTIVSFLFHWLASQSIFMVHLLITDSRTRLVSNQITSCGWSPMAIILTTSIGVVIAVGGYAMGSLKYPAGMPLAGSCSAAISAACHPPPEDTNPSLRPVQWGAVTGSKSMPGIEQPVGHCTFSSMPVEFPTVGQLYA